MVRKPVAQVHAKHVLRSATARVRVILGLLCLVFGVSIVAAFFGEPVQSGWRLTLARLVDAWFFVVFCACLYVSGRRPAAAAGIALGAYLALVVFSTILNPTANPFVWVIRLIYFLILFYAYRTAIKCERILKAKPAGAPAA